MGTDRGVLRARGFKRQPSEQRSDKHMLSKIVGTPWTSVPLDAAVDKLLVTLRMRVALVADAGELLAVPKAPSDGGLTRRIYLRRGGVHGSNVGQTRR